MASSQFERTALWATISHCRRHTGVANHRLKVRSTRRARREVPTWKRDWCWLAGRASGRVTSTEHGIFLREDGVADLMGGVYAANGRRHRPRAAAPGESAERDLCTVTESRNKSGYLVSQGRR